MFQSLCINFGINFIAVKESNNNRSLKGKKQSNRNSSSNVLQPFMAVIPFREESFRIIEKLFYGQVTIIIFCEPCERLGYRFRSFHKLFERFSYPLAIFINMFERLGNLFAKFTNPFKRLGIPFPKVSNPFEHSV